MIENDYTELGLPFDASPTDVIAAYKTGCKTKHPDAGGTQVAFTAFHAAYRRALDHSRSLPCLTCQGTRKSWVQRGFTRTSIRCIACVDHPGKRYPEK